MFSNNYRSNKELLNALASKLMAKDNIALAALLETKPAVWEQSQLPTEAESQHQQILVCTAHIHWDPEFCDVKLIHVHYILG
jgi:mRNA deadenylase 3'-5' endonuclease subunit Ccr4